MRRVEQLLLAHGCPKINLQVRAGNAEVLAFYRALGYAQDEVVAMGKRLVPAISLGTRVPRCGIDCRPAGRRALEPQATGGRA